jgi:heat-inducible transcriptional repressor
MRQVLLHIVEEYVSTAQPVASRRVARRVGVSPATVRNVMLDLAERDLLRQPHTSAGRVPTEQAFRVYVDELMHEAPWPRSSQSRAEGRLSHTGGRIDSLLREATDWLSESTGQLGFFLAGLPDRVILRRAHFIRLSRERVMALLVSERGVVQTRILDESESEERELERISTRLTEFVAGYTLSEARARLASSIERERERTDVLWRKAFALGVLGLGSTETGELYVADRNYLIGQPEFSDVERLRDVLTTLGEKERMMSLLDEILRADVLQVVIGGELHEPGIGGCAVVTAPFGAVASGEGLALGGIGVIGPVRMPYDRVIPVVRGVSEMIGAYLG